MKLVLIIAAILIILFILVKIIFRNPNLMLVEPTDEEMNSAIDKARKTVPEFIKVLQSPAHHQADFSVKKPFQVDDEGGTEHIWLEGVTFDGDAFHGKVGNIPQFLDNINLGDEASVIPDSISDWKYIDNGKLVGGYTIRVLVDKMPENQRKSFIEQLPFAIEHE